MLCQYEAGMMEDESGVSLLSTKPAYDLCYRGEEFIIYDDETMANNE